MKNIHSQLITQLQALQSAGLAAVASTFNIAAFYSPVDKQLFFLDIVTGLGTIFALASGVGPSLGRPARSVTAAILPAVGAYFDRHIKESPTALQPQEEFAAYLQYILKTMELVLEEVATKLFNGSQIEGIDSNFNITNMMKGGPQNQ